VVPRLGGKQPYVPIQRAANIEDGHVSFEDVSKVEVKGQGMVCYLQKDGLIGLLQDDYYIPDLKINILSMGQLTENGYTIFLKDRLKAIKEHKI